MSTLDQIKSKIEKNKEEKKYRLLENAYALFGEKGFNYTSIQDIVNKAGVAKGTFYLYFKDKFDIRDQLVAEKSSELFHQALTAMNNQEIEHFDDRIIFVINYVIDMLKEDSHILNFINKDLSLGFYSKEMSKIFDDNALGLYSLFIDGVKKNHIDMENPDITFFMIVELVGSTCYNSIVQAVPVDIDTYKPYLYKTIRTMLKG